MSRSRAERWLRPLGFEKVRSTQTYRLVRDPKWLVDRRATQSRSRLIADRNSEAGASGIIVGTGPSLNRTDLSAIGTRPSIGLNRLFQGFDQLGFRPTRLVCVNLLMLEQSARDIEQSGVPVLASWAARHAFRPGADVTYLRTMDGTDFSRALADRVYTGSTVTYVALQLAYWLGWKEVTLLGIDHSYRLESHEQTLSPHATSVRQRADENHFLTDYFPPGQSWQLPDLESSEQAYAAARRAFEADGRRIVDGTIGGALDIFEKSPWPERSVPSPLAAS